MLASIYARYSSAAQREASIEDQARNCERRAESEGWTVTASYEDRAISGATDDRPGYQALLSDALAGRWQCLLVDDLSRLSRDQVEAERTIRRLEHRGIIIIGVSDGYDSRAKSRKLHRGVRNLLNEVYLDDLREKTHRGLEGQARQGNNAGGRCYGYRHVPVEDPTRRDSFGRPLVVSVRREIDADQADVIRWIHERYAAGKSPGWIAADLNARGVPSPRGGTWASSCVYGSPGKTTGILRNPLYVGKYLWNRSTWIKDPDTRKRERRDRPAAEWLTLDMPELRIVPEDLWQRAQTRLNRPGRGEAIRQGIARKKAGGGAARHLFSGLLVCANCGHPFVTVGNGYYGCSGHKYRGAAVCAVATSVKRAVVERCLLAGIKRDLLNPEALELFHRETRRLLREAAEQSGNSGQLERARQELAATETKIGNLVAAIAAGTFSPALQSALEMAESDKRRLLAEIASAESIQSPAFPDFLPRTADVFREMVENLEDSLSADTDEAREILRGIVGDEILIQPAATGRHLEAKIKAGYLQQVSGLTLNMVAGAGFEGQSIIVPLMFQGGADL